LLSLIPKWKTALLLVLEHYERKEDVSINITMFF
jgi:hypothetical protein